VVVALAIGQPRRARGEDSADFKVMQYHEDGNRINVFAPTFVMQKDLNHCITIKIDGLYNSISGATPTGAPMQFNQNSVLLPPPLATPSPAGGRGGTRSVTTTPGSGTPAGGNSGGDEDNDRDVAGRVLLIPQTSALTGNTAQILPAALTTWNSLTGATVISPPTPAPTPTPKPKPSPAAPSPAPSPTPAPPVTPPASKGILPTADFSDHRYSVNAELSAHLDSHTPSVQLSYSTENDYDSIGVSLKDAMDLNHKNTTIVGGVAYTLDTIRPANRTSVESKHSLDGVVGLSQVLDVRTLLAVNLTVGTVDGFLSDPYKVVELNGALASEHRPDKKNKQIVHVSLTRYIDSLDAGVEASYRYYMDSFGIRGNTAELMWHQKIGSSLIVRPLLRYYKQSAADFYSVRFTGNPEFYSSDYRVSEFESFGYGIKLVWLPADNLTFDISLERYDQRGKDGVTPEEIYPKANVAIVGMKLLF